MIRIETELFISHPPETVWAALMDFAAYPKWNPFVFEINGEKSKGGKLNIKVNSPDGTLKTYDFKVYISIFEENKMLAWAGRPLFPWIFSGVHYFRLEAARGGTLFTHGETFAGIVPQFMRKNILQNFPKGYGAMNIALAKYLG